MLKYNVYHIPYLLYLIWGIDLLFIFLRVFEIYMCLKFCMFSVGAWTNITYLIISVVIIKHRPKSVTRTHVRVS